MYAMVEARAVILDYKMEAARVAWQNTKAEDPESLTLFVLDNSYTDYHEWEK